MSNTVLIVDDAEFMRVMLKDILFEMGLNVVGEAGNGREAVRLFRKLKPDLVALDITMPEMDGIEALQKIKAISPDALVVMITALGQKGLFRNRRDSIMCVRDHLYRDEASRPDSGAAPV